MIDRLKLIDDANELGLTFHKNTKTHKLIAMIAEARGEPIPVTENVPEGPAIKTEIPSDGSSEANLNNKKKTKIMLKREAIAKCKNLAFATRVVTITNKDGRENDVMTTAYLSFENQYFSLSKVVPLDIPVELENVLIDIAESTIISLHKDEVVNGRRTGNRKVVPVKKFAINYANSKVA